MAEPSSDNVFFTIEELKTLQTVLHRSLFECTCHQFYQLATDTMLLYQKIGLLLYENERIRNSDTL